MRKSDNTEQKLLEALGRLVKGTPTVCDGRVTQNNIASEAGVSRATLNRYPKVIEECRRVKGGNGTGDRDNLLTIKDSSDVALEPNVTSKVKLPQTMSEVKERLLAARQEIFVLTTALQVRDRSIAERDRQIAELRSQLMRLRQGKPNKFDLIESGTI